MKRLLPFLFLFFSVSTLQSQIFERVMDSLIEQTSADSRSVNVVDVDGDGWDDVFISNGPSNGVNNELYRNLGNGNFEMHQPTAITRDSAKSDGATFADIDNDGDLDAYVVTWYGDENDFYLNQGAGDFVRKPESGVDAFGSFAETASFGDYDNDGLVDLYVSISGGRNLQNLLFHNAGNGTFEPVALPETTDGQTHSRGVLWADIDNDFDQDLFIANENEESNNIFINSNEGEYPFTPLQNDQSVRSTTSSISGSFGDIDNDGDLDLFVANAGYFQPLNNQLFLNDGQGYFTEVTYAEAAQDGGASYGSAFGDVDNDGDLDLLVTNGFAHSDLADRLYENDGKGYFTRWDGAFDEMPDWCSFGAAFGDLDQDGFLDLVIAHCNNNTATDRPNSFFRNQGNNNHWLQVRLQGQLSNYSALGARVQVTTRIKGKVVVQTRHVEGQSGYGGQNSLTTHFGLGNAKQVIEVRVLWPSGIVTILEDLNSDQILNLKELEFPAEPLADHYLEFYPVSSMGDILVEAKGSRTNLRKSPKILLQNADGISVVESELYPDPNGGWRYKLESDLPSGRYLVRITCGKKTYLQRIYL